MPKDGSIIIDQLSAATKLRTLADFMTDLDADLLDLRTVHHACGTAHCAWGWGEVIGLFPKSNDGDEEAVWAQEMESAAKGCSTILGLNDAQFRHCFGMGYQFRNLGREYKPDDVARHLRETASELVGC